MADKYISAEQAYTYLRSVLYETATSTVGLWGFVLGMYHKLKVTIWKEEETDAYKGS